jgi:hypothetical protein
VFLQPHGICDASAVLRLWQLSMLIRLQVLQEEFKDLHKEAEGVKADLPSSEDLRKQVTPSHLALTPER